ncbi:MAG TPA: hypothetical protein VN580_13465 [Clostridia bacterium]|nr:hypothetical protein [Clostridia bacterium]
MNNAAIIIFNRSALPKLLSFFAVPRIIRSIQVGMPENKVTVHIVRCPVPEASAGGRKLAKALEGLCLEKNISYFIGRNTEYYPEGGMSSIEGRIARGDVEEIRAIKDLGVLMKLSAEMQVNLFKKNMCFIGEACSYQYISTMSVEAAGVVIYEHGKMDGSLKKSIFERLMAEKGISAVFTKDLEKAVAPCEIILADSTVELQGIQAGLAGKILIGDNAVTGDFEKVSRVLLWYEDIGKTVEDSVIACYNNELLGILRYFYKERNVADFIRRFPCIDFLRNNKPDSALH